MLVCGRMILPLMHFLVAAKFAVCYSIDARLFTKMLTNYDDGRGDLIVTVIMLLLMMMMMHLILKMMLIRMTILMMMKMMMMMADGGDEGDYYDQNDIVIKQ